MMPKCFVGDSLTPLLIPLMFTMHHTSHTHTLLICRPPAVGGGGAAAQQHDAGVAAGAHGGGVAAAAGGAHRRSGVGRGAGRLGGAPRVCVAARRGCSITVGTARVCSYSG